MVDDRAIARRFKLIEGHLDERQRRLVAAAEAQAVGVGGISMVARATGVSRRAIRAGLKELTARPASAGGRLGSAGLAAAGSEPWTRIRLCGRTWSGWSSR